MTDENVTDATIEAKRLAATASDYARDYLEYADMIMRKAETLMAFAKQVRDIADGRIAAVAAVGDELDALDGSKALALGRTAGELQGRAADVWETVDDARDIAKWGVDITAKLEPALRELGRKAHDMPR